MARLHSLIALVAITGTAFAQSKRYPAPPKDADKEAESHSHLWESALDPERKPYDELVAEAAHLLDDTQHPVDAATNALAKLDQAIERLPKDYRARALRGHAFVLLKKWDKCADELALAETSDVAGSELEAVELELGICQARAGKLADAERTLVHLVTIAPKAESWLRLGEVRIALGKLDEAVDALSASLDIANSVTAHWLLGLAYDRARKSNAADNELRAALRADASLHDLQYPKYPWLRSGEGDYMFGLAKQTSPENNSDPATPEVALVYFKRFLHAAPDSPWRRRAEEHVKELSALPFPLALKREPQSSAFVEPGSLVPIVQKAMPAMRACAAKLPSDVFVVTVIKAGPKETNAERPHYAVPASSTRVALYLELDTISQLQEDAAIACITPIASRLPLPSPKERDTYYQMSFLVVAP